MKINKMELKTHYAIKITFHDFLKVFTDAKDDIKRLDAFKEFNLEDTTIGNIRSCFKKLDSSCFSSNCKQSCEDLNYIIHKLGFDGIDNYGGFFDTEEYSVWVYKWGDHVNPE